jgi:hypothetical protein
VLAGSTALTAPWVTESTSHQSQFPQQHCHRTELPEAYEGNQALERPLPTDFALPREQQRHRTVLLEAHGGNQAPELPLPEGFILLSWQQCHGTVLPEARVGNWAPELPPHTDFVLQSKQHYHRTGIPEAPVVNQAPKLPLHPGFVLWCLQHLPWILEDHTPTQADPRASAAWWAPHCSYPLASLPHGYPQSATQCQEPATTHQVNPRLQALPFCRLPFPEF